VINFQKWYCPNCGMAESKGDYRDDMFICRGCDRQQFKRTPPLFVTAMTARIATLEALIADAPHSKDCPRSSKHSSFLSCNCFKSRALDTGAKG